MTALEISKAALPHRFAPQAELFRPERAFSPTFPGEQLGALASLGLLCALGKVDSPGPRPLALTRGDPLPEAAADSLWA